MAKDQLSDEEYIEKLRSKEKSKKKLASIMMIFYSIILIASITLYVSFMILMDHIDIPGVYIGLGFGFVLALGALSAIRNIIDYIFMKNDRKTKLLFKYYDEFKNRENL